MRLHTAMGDAMTLHTARFLAKDGIVVHDGLIGSDAQRLRLVAGAGSGLRLLRAAGFSFLVISNEPEVALVLLDDGGERKWCLSETRLPHHVALDFDEAARLILEDEHILDWRQRMVATPAR